MKIIPFKQFIKEDLDLDTKLKKLGLKRGNSHYPVGKVIGGEVYVHKAYENQFPDVPLQNAKNALPKDFKYDVVKFNPKTGTFSFITSNDFDEVDEPSVHGGITVKSDGSSKAFKDAGWIYHHKWQWVADDYKGFDVEESKKRSLKWASLDNVDKTRIGQRKHWDTHVVPRLEESIKQLPDMFSSTYYRLPTQEDLENINKFDLSVEDIINGFSYTIIGRGMNNESNKEKIKQSLTMLSEKYPKNQKYKKAVTQYEKHLNNS